MDKILSVLLRILSFAIPFIRTGEKRRWIAGIFLIIGNAAPAIGVLFLHWSPLWVLLLFWSESGIVGFYNILKMLSSGFLCVKGFRPAGIFLGIFLSAFFTVHYAGFMAGHLVFILLFFAQGAVTGVHSFFSFLLSDVYVLESFSAAFLLLVFSHGYNFYATFIRERWYLDHEPSDFMMSPYSRIVVMQLTIIFGAFLMLLTGWKPSMVVLLVGMKTIVDLYAVQRTSVPSPSRRSSSEIPVWKRPVREK